MIAGRKKLLLSSFVVLGLGCWASGQCRAQNPSEVMGKPADTSPSLESVQWAGQGVTEAVKGKTTMILSFVTYITPDWYPEMLAQFKKAAADRPVVILAIATDADAAKAKAYMTANGLTGPNVLYGSA